MLSQLTVALILAISGYQDWRRGEVSGSLNKALLLLLPIAVLKCLLLEEWLSVFLMLGFFALWYFGMLGGADAKLLMLLSALAGAKTAAVAFAGAYLLGYSASLLLGRAKLWLLLLFSTAYLLFGELALLIPAVAAFQSAACLEAVHSHRFRYLPYLMLCYLLMLGHGFLPYVL